MNAYQSTSQPREAVQHQEGQTARAIEHETAKMPSDTFLWTAVGAMGVSLIFEIAGKGDKSRFFGQWVAPLLVMGLYNKICLLYTSD
ncbi:MAG: hypothetical protein QUU85_10115, partial [Candidatus Eisenbacteria bacterium]|nr:hypothetical protein [Candidatus Eisenbacteria bacterium]